MAVIEDRWFGIERKISGSNGDNMNDDNGNHNERKNEALLNV